MNHEKIWHLLRSAREYLPLIIFLVLTPLMLIISYLRRQRQAEKLKALAIKLGLQFQDPSRELDLRSMAPTASYSGRQRPQAEKAYRRLEAGGFLKKLQTLAQPLAIGGRYNGFMVELKLRSQNKSNFTEISVHFPQPLDLGLRISKAGFWTRLALSQAPRVESGNAELDRSVTIASRDASRAKYIAKNFEVQQALRTLFRHQGVEIDDRGAFIRQSGYQTDYARVKTLLDDAARALTTILQSLGRD